MSHSPFTNLGSNQDHDDWHSQKVDLERESQILFMKSPTSTPEADAAEIVVLEKFKLSGFVESKTARKLELQCNDLKAAVSIQRKEIENLEKQVEELKQEASD